LGVLIQTARHNDSPRERQQARLWIVGMAIAVPLSMTNLLATLGVPVYPFGNLASVAYASFIAYSIVRYRLMDIDIVLTKGAAYSLVTLGVIAPACALSVWLQSAAFGRVSIDFSVALFALFFLVATIFPLLRSVTESRLERSLFPRRYEHRTELADFTRAIVRILDRDELVTRVAETLESTLSVDRLVVAVLDDSRRALVAQYSSGVPPTIGEFSLDHPFVELLSQRNDAVLLDELEASPVSAEHTTALDVCRINGWELSLPLVSGRRVLGFIAMGRKRNRAPYFATELDLLTTLAAEAAVAMDNARLHQELTRSQEIIRRADRLSALGTLAAGIAHEIRNPLVSIQTFFQLAPHRLQDQEFLTEFLRLTSSEVKRITDLISDLLSFARSPTPSMSKVDLNELLEGVVRLLEPQLRTEQITVEKDLDARLQPVNADRDQLKQVFLNIILNAAQAIDGKGTIRISSRAAAHKGESFCQIEIADSGAGIPADLLDDIFNPFFTTKDKGTGLGLAITNQVVSEHDGFISVESEVGKGTRFQINLRPAVHVAAYESVDDGPQQVARAHRKHW
jgi:signal transduction histidine kinase